jgi:hypothetical protein
MRRTVDSPFIHPAVVFNHAEPLLQFNERETTSLFAQPEWRWRLRTLTMIPPTTGREI